MTSALLTISLLILVLNFALESEKIQFRFRSVYFPDSLLSRATRAAPVSAARRTRRLYRRPTGRECRRRAERVHMHRSLRRFEGRPLSQPLLYALILTHIRTHIYIYTFVAIGPHLFTGRFKGRDGKAMSFRLADNAVGTIRFLDYAKSNDA